ncbi:hypothetical protein B0T21DRAFT_431312 [Apiosordaria backusii]|uniref:Uncharacterized protein n=1 Tax=Apiosordaria backusii TaxID=314023 RepID=A0AA39ZV76_9PEZI|nr:hypothetical protein B0T21DRAFT_431312 [Apiosordaria backusii]
MCVNTGLKWEGCGHTQISGMDRCKDFGTKCLGPGPSEDSLTVVPGDCGSCKLRKMHEEQRKEMEDPRLKDKGKLDIYQQIKAEVAASVNHPPMPHHPSCPYVGYPEPKIPPEPEPEPEPEPHPEPESKQPSPSPETKRDDTEHEPEPEPSPEEK